MKTALATMILALALMLGATGCLIIPTPHSDSGYARTNVNQHAKERFVPGQTSREDVIVTLGEPDAVSSDERQLAYRSEKIVAFWIIGGGYNATGGTIYKNRFYIFEFDPQGRFQTIKQTGQWGMVEGSAEPQLSPPALTSTDANRVSAMIAGARVKREYPRSFWLPGVDGYRSKGATTIAGQAGDLICTESNLAFMAASQFANTEPALTLPMASVAEARVDEWSPPLVWSRCRLVVRLHTGEVHSFEINKPGSFRQDQPAIQSTCDFIQSKIKPPQPKK